MSVKSFRSSSRVPLLPADLSTDCTGCLHPPSGLHKCCYAPYNLWFVYGSGSADHVLSVRALQPKTQPQTVIAKRSADQHIGLMRQPRPLITVAGASWLSRHPQSTAMSSRDMAWQGQPFTVRVVDSTFTEYLLRSCVAAGSRERFLRHAR